MSAEPIAVKEAAALLGITTRTVRLWIESGRLLGERVEGKFGPEWRLDSEQVRSLADHRTEEPMALDVAERPGGNALRGLVSMLGAEMRRLHDQQIEHAKYLASISQRLDALTAVLPSPEEDAALQGLIRQSAQMQQTVEEESRSRHREAQELQASVQALSGALHEQTELVARLTAEITALRTRPLPWYRRLFRS